MRLTVAASSSKGNCYVLDSGKEILLLECGIPFPGIRKAFNFDLSRVAGCLVTHEHQDHAKAIKEVMAAGIDVHASQGTFEALGASGYRACTCQEGASINLGSWIIVPFPTQHDAKEPLGFLIYHQPTKEKLIFATDTYYIRNRFKNPNYIMVECNYCKDILAANVAEGIVTEAQRQRIIQSHFELENVKNFLKANVSTDTRAIVLLHLSDDNSSATRMVDEVESLTGVKTYVAETGLVVDLNLFPF